MSGRAGHRVRAPSSRPGKHDDPRTLRPRGAQACASASPSPASSPGLPSPSAPPTLPCRRCPPLFRAARAPRPGHFPSILQPSGLLLPGNELAPPPASPLPPSLPATAPSTSPPLAPGARPEGSGPGRGWPGLGTRPLRSRALDRSDPNGPSLAGGAGTAARAGAGPGP